MKSYIKTLLILPAIGLVCSLVPTPSKAIPAFHRKYELSCTACHTMPPKLNTTGQEFRKLGYRFPYEVEDTKPPAKDKAPDKSMKKSSADDTTKNKSKMDAMMPSHNSDSDKDKMKSDTMMESHNTESQKEKGPAADSPAQVQKPTESQDTTEIGQLKHAILLLQQRVDELEQREKGKVEMAQAPQPAPQPKKMSESQEIMEKMGNLSNVIAVRGDIQYNAESNSDSGKSNGFNTSEVSLFYAGQATRNLSFWVQETFAADGEASSLEEARAQYNFYKDPTHYLAVRVGQMHAIYEEGFGAFDRPLGISAPLALTSSYPNSSAFSFDATQIGLQTYYNFDKTRIIGTVLNGIDPGGGGTGLGDSNNSKDYSVGLEHIFNDAGSSLSLYYYHGLQNANLFEGNDSFDRIAVGGNYTIEPITLDIIGGLVYGRDKGSGSSIESKGAFLELDKKLLNDFYALARYDYLSPNNSTGSNADVHGGTIGLVYLFQEHTRLSGEYQYIQDNGLTYSSGKDDHKLTLDLQFLF